MRYLFVALLIFLISCKSAKKGLTAQQIVDKTITTSGVDKIANSKVTFHFRDKKYTAIRENGKFSLSRSYQKDTLVIDEFLTNDGCKRLINTKEVKVSDSIKHQFSNSINSVHYFSVLPFGLNDKAVKKKLLPSTTIKGKEYYKIQITFSEEGGGEDHDDVFMYWIGKNDFLVDYLAYSYHTNGGGKRFRVLKEQCIKEGVRFVDYHNYEPLDKTISLIDIDKAFEENQLKKVSEIVLKDIKVELLK